MDRSNEIDIIPTLDAGQVSSWEMQRRHFPLTGRPGISLVRPRQWVYALLFCDREGVLRGICCYFPEDYQRADGTSELAGNISLFVDPTCYRQGIGMQLLLEADRRWQINFMQQYWTHAGAALANAYLRTHKRRPAPTLA